ncbi:MAG: transposase, partial [Bacteroidota bacterium]|nr:transposase [Bacteroidota bacterium]
MEKGSNGNQDKESSESKRSGSEKRSKTSELPIHETIKIPAENVPEGSVFKGHKDFVVQGLIIKCHNICYRMERWETLDGGYVEGKLPSSVRGHFDSVLVSYAIYQYHQCCVTQPLLLEALHEFGVDISSGQLNRILVEGHVGFHQEKDDILSAGLEIGSYINVDDTGARHNGKNGYCTHIGNDLFAWFESTESKSRINFLKLLRAGYTDYHVNSESLIYMKTQKLPEAQFQLLDRHDIKVFPNSEQWENHLQRLGITHKR